jgi:hypothetical protein
MADPELATISRCVRIWPSLWDNSTSSPPLAVAPEPLSAIQLIGVSPRHAAVPNLAQGPQALRYQNRVVAARVHLIGQPLRSPTATPALALFCGVQASVLGVYLIRSEACMHYVYPPHLVFSQLRCQLSTLPSYRLPEVARA